MNAVTVAPSLFDRPASAVLSAASDWITATLFGALSVSLCVIAVALLGLAMLAGRVVIRDGLRAAIGCFVLLGAPTIATGLQSAAVESARPAAPQMPVVAATPAPPPLSPSNYDPYAGASLHSE